MPYPLRNPQMPYPLRNPQNEEGTGTVLAPSAATRAAANCDSHPGHLIFGILSLSLISIVASLSLSSCTPPRVLPHAPPPPFPVPAPSPPRPLTLPAAEDDVRGGQGEGPSDPSLVRHPLLPPPPMPPDEIRCGRWSIRQPRATGARQRRASSLSLPLLYHLLHPQPPDTTRASSWGALQHAPASGDAKPYSLGRQGRAGGGAASA
jgi:hypothetical protein